MDHMFCNAKKFNHSLDMWDVSNVRVYRNVLFGARSFKQNISNWKIFGKDKLKISRKSQMKKKIGISSNDCNILKLINNAH
jgi:hypothetical protein